MFDWNVAVLSSLSSHRQGEVGSQGRVGLPGPPGRFIAGPKVSVAQVYFEFQSAGETKAAPVKQSVLLVRMLRTYFICKDI